MKILEEEYVHVNPLYMGNPLTSSFANSADPDEMHIR